MSTTSIQLPFLQSDGLSRADRRITLAAQKKQDLAVMIVHVRDVERLCASVGHARAGAALDDFYTQLRAIARENDAIERIGDRKFAVLLNGLKNRGHIGLAAQKIQRLAQDTLSNHAECPDLDTTIGVSLCPRQGEDGPELMRLAEIAALDGRRRNESVCFFEERSARRLFTDWGLEKRFDSALQAGELQLHYQPKLCLESNAIVGAEALMRWHDADIGPISPEVFINLAEASGHIAGLTQFAIQNACRQLAEWRELAPDLNIAVNVTPSTIQSNDVVDVLQSATTIWDVPADKLTLEVTENALMEHREVGHQVLTRIRGLGVRTSIDDFGTGYSSLAYLKEVPADELKIDRCFVMGMLEDDGDYKIVEHAIGIAKSFGLSVVAEGVENEAALAALRKLGCDYAQGYFIHEPVAAADFEAFYEGRRS